MPIPQENHRAATHSTHTASDPTSTKDASQFLTDVSLPSSTERYRLGLEIARGGMGAVYQATDTAFGREVAVKVLLDKYAPNSATAHRFHDEARITGQLQHPGIPPVHDLGMLPDGRRFLAMKLIKGDTLDDLIKDRPDRARLVAVFEKVCEAVSYAHAHGVVHRDLKPSNVMVGNFGEVQVMDWGLAKVLNETRTHEVDEPDATAAGTIVRSSRDSEDVLTQAGSVLGTPAYMPPEQALGATHEIDTRSDVFGLGGILVAILTGKPPFIGDTAATTRVMAARAEVADCFERLDDCGADPELVALCKRCLAPQREDRPAHAGVVGQAVAALRAAADDRVKQAELDKVKAEGEVATAAAAAAERRKRRRVWLTAAAVLSLVVISGLAAVLQVQRNANTNLNSKNAALEAERAKVEARFQLASKAVAAFHTGVSKDTLLKNVQFKELRTRLLKEAVRFYAEMEQLLVSESDPKSRLALANGYSQLGDLIEQIGDREEALETHRKALSLFREIASETNDAHSQLNVARSLGKVGVMLEVADDIAGALKHYEEKRDICLTLKGQVTTKANREVLQDAYNEIGILLMGQKKWSRAEEAFESRLKLCEQLVAEHSTDELLQSSLATAYSNLGILLSRSERAGKAIEWFRRALVIQQSQAKAHPDDPFKQREFANTNNSIGAALYRNAKYREALDAYQASLSVYRQLITSHPAMTQFQVESSYINYNIAETLEMLGSAHGALAAFQAAAKTLQSLADKHPTVVDYQSYLVRMLQSVGRLSDCLGKYEESRTAFETGRDVYQKMLNVNPSDRNCQNNLAWCQTRLGRAEARLGRFSKAFAELENGLMLFQRLANSFPEDTSYQIDLGYIYSFRGATHARAGNPDKATTDLRMALKQWAKSADLDGEDLFEKAKVLALLAKLGANPKSGVTGDEVKSFTDQAIVALTASIKAGRAWTAEWKDMELDVLRDRADFQKLLAQVEAKQKSSELAPPALTNP